MITGFIAAWIALNKFLILGSFAFAVVAAIMYRTIGTDYFDKDPKLDPQEKIKLSISIAGITIFLGIGTALIVTYFI